MVTSQSQYPTKNPRSELKKNKQIISISHSESLRQCGDDIIIWSMITYDESNLTQPVYRLHYIDDCDDDYTSLECIEEVNAWKTQLHC